MSVDESSGCLAWVIMSDVPTAAHTYLLAPQHVIQLGRLSTITPIWNVIQDIMGRI